MKNLIHNTIALIACLVISFLASYSLAQKKPHMTKPSAGVSAYKDQTTSQKTKTRKNNSTQYKNNKKTTKTKKTPNRKSSTTINQDAQPQIATTLSVSSTNVQFDASGGQSHVYINSNKEWRISAWTTNWSTLTRNGNYILINASKNNSTKKRIDYFAIEAEDKSVRVDIIQSGEEPYLILSDSFVQFDYDGGTKSIVVNSNTDWSVNDPLWWVNAKRSGNEIVLTARQNNSSSSNIGHITITYGNESKTISMAQSSKPYVTQKTNPTNYTYSSSNTYAPENNSNYSKNNNKESWWKGRIAVGLELTGDLNSSLKSFPNNSTSYTYGAGARLRFGRYTDLFNLTLGTKYQKCGYIGMKYSSYKMEADYIAFPINLKFNLFSLSQKSKLFVGTGYEFYYPLGYASEFMSWNAGIGTTSRHVDWYLFGKNVFFNNNKALVFLNEKWRLGTSIAVYF